MVAVAFLPVDRLAAQLPLVVAGLVGPVDPAVAAPAVLVDPVVEVPLPRRLRRPLPRAPTVVVAMGVAVALLAHPVALAVRRQTCGRCTTTRGVGPTVTIRPWST